MIDEGDKILCPWTGFTATISLITENGLIVEREDGDIVFDVEPGDVEKLEKEGSHDNDN